MRSTSLEPVISAAWKAVQSSSATRAGSALAARSASTTCDANRLAAHMRAVLPSGLRPLTRAPASRSRATVVAERARASTSAPCFRDSTTTAVRPAAAPLSRRWLAERVSADAAVTVAHRSSTAIANGVRGAAGRESGRQAGAEDIVIWLENDSRIEGSKRYMRRPLLLWRSAAGNRLR